MTSILKLLLLQLLIQDQILPQSRDLSPEKCITQVADVDDVSQSFFGIEKEAIVSLNHPLSEKGTLK